MTQEKPRGDRINWRHSIPVILVHLAPLLALWTGARRIDWILCFVLYGVRMFFLTAGYHRYFAHRSYKLGRAMQFVMAFGGGMAAQKGVLWWAAHHRDHHLYSDTERDIHSPIKGFWWSHVIWFMCGAHKETKFERVKEFAAYPELRWLNRWWIVPPTALGLACWFFGGTSTLLIGFMLSTVLLWHGTFTINSLAHVWGSRRYATPDSSRNNGLLAIVTLGEGWHNNHHHMRHSVKQGFRWWEIDISYYILKILSWFRLVRGMITPTKAELERRRLHKGARDLGMEATRALRAAHKEAKRYYTSKRQALGEVVESARQAADEIVSPQADKARADS